MIKGLTIYTGRGGLFYLISAIQPPLFHVLILIIRLIISIKLKKLVQNVPNILCQLIIAGGNKMHTVNNKLKIPLL